MPKKTLAIGRPERTTSLKVADAILGLIAQVPNTDEPRRTVAQAVRDSVVHVGAPILVQGVPLGAMQAIARAVGISITGRAIGKAYPDGPIIGALRVGSYAYCGSKPLAAAQRITSYILLGPPGEPCHASVVAAS